MIFSIKELKINEEDETGVQAISFVDNPAIETNFEYFAVGKKLPYFKYTAYPEPEILPKDQYGNERSHEFCREHAGKVYHESEIRTWSDPTSSGWIEGVDFFTNFNGDTGGPNYEGTYSFNCDSQLYSCRHKLVRVAKKADVPANKRSLAPDIEFVEQHFVKMEMLSELKREVQGLVLRSNQMIYRNDVDGEGTAGYVYFSKDTIKKLHDKYGFNRSISFQHRDDITGQAILLDSWLEEDDKETKWFVKYKIIGEKLWTMIQQKKVQGFSIEALFNIR